MKHPLSLASENELQIRVQHQKLRQTVNADPFSTGLILADGWLYWLRQSDFLISSAAAAKVYYWTVK